MGEEAGEDGVGVDALRFGVEVEQDAMTQDGEGDRGDVVVGDVVVVAGKSAAFAARTMNCEARMLPP